jgi:hypothetical protein
MASPIPAADVDASVLDAAGARLAAALSGAPAPVPVAPVVPAVAAPPGSPPAEPQPAPTPTNAFTLDLSSLPPDAAKMLEIAGGDPIKALQLGLQYNNRLGSKGQAQSQPQPPPPAEAVPAPATPEPAPVQAAPQPDAEPEPPPETLADPQAVVENLKVRLDSDPSVQPLVDSWQANETRLRELGDPAANTGLFGQIHDQIRTAELRLKIPEVQNDPLLRTEIAEEIKQARAELITARTEAMTLRAEQRELTARYNQAAEEHRRLIATDLGRRVAAQRYAQRITQAWPTAVDRAIADTGIPKELRSNFAKRAHDTFMLAINRGQSIGAHELAPFLNALGKEMAQELDTAHRIRSGEYGRQAAQRTAAFAAPPGVAAPQVPVAPAQVPSQSGLPDLDAVERSAAERMSAWTRALVGR